MLGIDRHDSFSHQVVFEVAIRVAPLAWTIDGVLDRPDIRASHNVCNGTVAIALAIRVRVREGGRRVRVSDNARSLCGPRDRGRTG